MRTGFANRDAEVGRALWPILRSWKQRVAFEEAFLSMKEVPSHAHVSNPKGAKISSAQARAERAVKEAAERAFGDAYRPQEAKTFSQVLTAGGKPGPRFNRRGVQFACLVNGSATLNGKPMAVGEPVRIDTGQVYEFESERGSIVTSHVFPFRDVLCGIAYRARKQKATGPLVTLVVIAKDIENHIDHCLLSCALQTHENLQVVVVVDRSTDDTALRAQAMCRRDKRFEVHVAKDPLGPNGARRLGLRRTRGEYCLLLDGDDWINDDAVERLVEVAQSQQAECVAFGFDHHNDRTREMWDPVLPTSVIVSEGPLFYSKEPHWALGVSTLNHTVWMYFFSARLIEVAENALPDLTLYEDLPFFLALIEHSRKTSIANQVFYHYRRDRLGQTTQNWTGVPPGMKVACLEVAFDCALDAMRTDPWFHQLILLYKIERVYLHERRVCRLSGDVEGLLAWDRCWIRLIAKMPGDLEKSIVHGPTRKRFRDARRPLMRAIQFNRRALRLRNNVKS